MMDYLLEMEIELERYKGELVKHCNKTLDLIAEARRNEDVNDAETQSYLKDLLAHALNTQRNIASVNIKLEVIKMRRNNLEQ